tara:strand:- start:134 stop:343 length:210 start_codon:yes stop_codon:yes gene_type:complete
MKKINDHYPLNSNIELKKNLLIDQIKTTNINILLNRVKIEKKNDFKKKMFLTSLMLFAVTFFSAIVIYI